MPDIYYRTGSNPGPGNFESVDVVDTIPDGAGVITAYADSATAPGVDTQVTAANHGITADDVTNGRSVTISGSTAGEYDGTFVVTRIVDANNLDIAKVFGTDPGDGTMLIERFYRITPGMNAGIQVNKNGADANVNVSFQHPGLDAVQNANINYSLVSSGSTDYFKGDSSLLGLVKVDCNPSGGAVEIVVVNGYRRG